jgi:hypothetical protein
LKTTDYFHSLLFPEQYRSLPQRRLLLNVFRSIHILCFSILIGGLYFNQPLIQLNAWALALIVSGVCLFLIDLYGSAIVLFEVRGITVLVKVLLLALTLALPADKKFNMLVLVMVFSTFISHSPRWLRHKNLLPEVLLKKLAPQDGKISRVSAK